MDKRAGSDASRLQGKTEYARQSDYDFDVSGVTAANAQEMQRIKTEAQASGTFMQAPNGKATKLNERQWLQVRTEAFKQWFGDWQLANKLQSIEDLAAIGIKPHNLSNEQLYEAYKNLGDGKNKYDNREVRFVNDTYGKITRNKGLDVKQIIPQLKDVFNHSVPIYSEQEQQRDGHKPHNNFVGYHNYLGKIEIDGKDYYVRFTVQEVNAKPQTIKRGFVPNELHSTFVSDVEIYKNSAIAPVPSGLLTRPRQPQSGITKTANNLTDAATNGAKDVSGVIDTKLQQFFEKAREARENSSKALDENGEPLVLYHYTSENFTVFDPKEARQNADLPSFYFSANRTDWKDMGNRVISAFLNIRNVTEKPNAAMRGAEAKASLREKGFDGTIITEDGEIVEYAAFDPNQIKSATSNNGNFDNQSDDIRFQFAGDPASSAEATPDGKGQEGTGKKSPGSLNTEGEILSSHNNNPKSERDDEVSERVPQGKYGAQAQVDSRIEDALAECRRASEEGVRDAQAVGRTISGQQQKELENRAAEIYAKEKGLWIPLHDVSSLGTPIPSGNENDVYLDAEGLSVYKVNNLLNSKTVSGLLERVLLHNRYFPETRYQLVGFSGFGSGNVYPVLKQDFIEDATFATPEEIKGYMESIGFHQMGEWEYSNGEIIISDLRPRNVVKNVAGDIFVVDAEFKQAPETEEESPSSGGLRFHIPEPPVFKQGDTLDKILAEYDAYIRQARTFEKEYIAHMRKATESYLRIVDQAGQLKNFQKDIVAAGGT
ncbi:MAG: hypothetical protein LBU44_02515, partial [Mediterranea sp.]|nr:hypothetical protein [Mediterranea sp.]